VIPFTADERTSMSAHHPLDWATAGRTAAHAMRRHAAFAAEVGIRCTNHVSWRKATRRMMGS
jgi:hypothetical protein